MTAEAGPFEMAKKVADTVLYEGYVLYPYRASSNKNQVRWQFGVLLPQTYNLQGADTCSMQTECLLEPRKGALVSVGVRFLQVQRRRFEKMEGEAYQPVDSLEVDGSRMLPWDEGVDREVDVGTFQVETLHGQEHQVPFAIAAGEDFEPVAGADGTVTGRIVRRRSALEGVVRLSAETIDDGRLVRLRVHIANLAAWDRSNGLREDALTRSLVAVHTLLRVKDGAFVSLIDPPEWAEQAAGACENKHTWPVLVGEEGATDVMLSSPIILYDYPEVAAESPGEFFDATEIDELLALRVMTLTEEEKQEARATDDRAAAIIDRCDIMPPEVMSRLHGAVRGLKAVTGQGPTGWREAAEPDLPEPATGQGPTGWREAAEPDLPEPATADALQGTDFGSDFESFLNGGAVNPEDDRIHVAGAEIGKGSRVLLRPLRRADAQDIFVSGRSARVERILRDVDGETHVAVTLEDDPASDLHQWYGRFMYFSPDEVVPLAGEAIHGNDNE